MKINQYILPLFASLSCINAFFDGVIRDSNNIIEMYYEGQYMPVCQNKVDYKVATLLCKDLNYAYYTNIIRDQSCADAPIIAEREADSIVGNYGIDLGKQSDACQASQGSFLECLTEGDNDIHWGDSDPTECGENSCFKVECTYDAPTQSQLDELYGKIDSGDNEDDLKLTSDNQLYVVKDGYYQPICSIPFGEEYRNSLCQDLGYDKYQSHKQVACDAPENKGFRTDLDNYEVYCFNWNGGDDYNDDCAISTDFYCWNNEKACTELKCRNYTSSETATALIVTLIVVGLIIFVIIAVIRSCYVKKRQQQQPVQVVGVAAVQPINSQPAQQDPNMMMMQPQQQQPPMMMMQPQQQQPMMMMQPQQQNMMMMQPQQQNMMMQPQQQQMGGPVVGGVNVSQGPQIQDVTIGQDPYLSQQQQYQQPYQQQQQQPQYM